VNATRLTESRPSRNAVRRHAQHGDARDRVVGPCGAAAGPPGMAGGADAAVLQLGRGPPDHGHRDLWPGPAGPRTLLQAGRSQLGAQR